MGIGVGCLLGGTVVGDAVGADELDDGELDGMLVGR